jgi:hypothetical protein
VGDSPVRYVILRLIFALHGRKHRVKIVSNVSELTNAMLAVAQDGVISMVKRCLLS